MMISARPPLPAAVLLRVQAARLRPQVEHAEVRRLVDPQRRCPRARCRPAAPSPSRCRRPGPCAACRWGSARAWRSGAGRARSPTSRARRRRPGASSLTATCSAMLATRPDLPMPGRAARMIRLPGWKPPVIRSRSANPDGVPVTSAVPLASSSSRSTSRERISVSTWKSSACSSWATLKQQLLGALGELARLALAVVDGLLDLAARPPAGGAGASSAGRSARSGGRCPATGTVEARLETASRPPTSVELALLGEELGDGERVDRLAALVEPFDRAEDDPVALAVEVLLGQADVEDHRVHRDSETISAPSTDCLGLEVLGWDVGGGGFHRSVGLEGGRRRIRPGGARGPSKPQRRRDRARRSRKVGLMVRGDG